MPYPEVMNGIFESTTLFGLRRIALAAAALAGMACAGFAPALAGDRPEDEVAWGAVALPSPSQSQVIGTYSNGCIAGAVPLPADGAGYSVIRTQRNRFYGHPRLIEVIQDLGFAALRDQMGVLMIADMGQPRGGPISGHASHELGLDADIWLRLLPGNIQDVGLRGDPVAYSAVIEGTDEIDRTVWTPAHVALYRAAATHPYVDRIFANPVIKRELCESATGDRSWLNRIRPWYGHDSHLHVRLSCPPDSPECQPQSAIPAGEGCGSDLDWWFTDGPYQPSTDPVPPPPPLPASCVLVLAE